MYGPRTNTLTPVKSADGTCLLTDLSDITGRWREHFNILLNQQGSARGNATATLVVHPTRHELDEPITADEVAKALKQTRSGKSPGADGIPSDVLKHGGQTVANHLLNLYNLCWEQEQLPQDFKDALIVTIYKKKGERSDCGNHRGISLLSIAGKVFAKILLNRLKQVSESVLPESQCGFRAGRSTSDMIFTLRQLQEKAVEQQQTLYIVFVDFSKAFDTVDRSTLWDVMKVYGCPDKFTNMVRQFHDNMTAVVSGGGSTSTPFSVCHGVKQGCVLAPTLFVLYLAAVLEYVGGRTTKGVYIRMQSDGNLFNLARLCAATKTKLLCVRELLYADDSALVATSLH